MSFFDLIRELRKGEPDVKKAARAMRILGWISVAGAIWNFAIYYLAPFDESPFNLPENYPYLALIILLSLGAAFFLSARGIADGVSWGKKLGQLAVLWLLAAIIGAMVFFFPDEFIFSEHKVAQIMFAVFMVVFSAQFFVPAYFGIRYLGRIPVKGDIYPDHRFDPVDRSATAIGRTTMAHPTARETYKEALLPYGIFGTFALLIAVPLVLFFMAEKFLGPQRLAPMFFPVFLCIFFGPVLYNFLPSSFERERSRVAAHTGGGSIFLFSGSWPFFRLLIYDDGVEIRVMLHRFFIPYDKLEDLPSKVGFFSLGIRFTSNLPGVPSNIRFYSFGIKKILTVLNEKRGGSTTPT